MLKEGEFYFLFEGVEHNPIVENPHSAGFKIMRIITYSSVSSLAVGLSNNSTIAIGALSPSLKPHLMIRK